VEVYTKIVAFACKQTHRSPVDLSLFAGQKPWYKRSRMLVNSSGARPLKYCHCPRIAIRFDSKNPRKGIAAVKQRIKSGHLKGTHFYRMDR
jgi:hypothetical protein